MLAGFAENLLLSDVWEGNPREAKSAAVLGCTRACRGVPPSTPSLATAERRNAAPACRIGLLHASGSPGKQRRATIYKKSVRLRFILFLLFQAPNQSASSLHARLQYFQSPITSRSVFSVPPSKPPTFSFIAASLFLPFTHHPNCPLCFIPRIWTTLSPYKT